MSRPFINHRFNGEHHAFFQTQTCSRLAIMKYLRIFVINLANAVPAVFAHYRKPLRFHQLLNSMANIAKRCARPHLTNAGKQGCTRNIHQTLGFNRRLAGIIHTRGIAMPAIFDDGNIDIDDIAIFQHFCRRWNAVANNVIHRCADTGRKAFVTHVGRNRLLSLNNVFMAQAVKLGGTNAWTHVRTNHLQDFSRQTASNAHFFDILFGFDSYLHGSIIQYLRKISTFLYNLRALPPTLSVNRRIHTSNNYPHRGA